MTRVVTGEPSPPSTGKRLIAALAVAMLSGAFVLVYASRGPGAPDFDVLWTAGRALWHGHDPYAVIGPGRAYPRPWPLIYPAPAFVAVLPLTVFPVVWARALFAALGGGALAYAVTRDGYGRLPIFASSAYLISLTLVQWSPLLAAMALVPPLAAFSICKPNIGAAVVLAAGPGRTWRWAAGGAAVLLAVSFIALPTWLESWLGNARGEAYVVAPITRPGGVLLLLALARWRRPEARRLLALACVPQTPGYYDLLPVLLVAERRVEMALLALCSYLPVLILRGGPPLRDPADFPAWGAALGTAAVWTVYLPALVLVLRRPNSGVAAPWLERRLARLRVPAWLRGTPAQT